MRAFTDLHLDYSMLSKTNVHHFAGNNVSHDLISKMLPVDHTRRQDSVLRVRPAKEPSIRLWRVHIDADNLVQIELGTACGKLYRCSTMAVLDAGDSDILSGQTS